MWVWTVVAYLAWVSVVYNDISKSYTLRVCHVYGILFLIAVRLLSVRYVHDVAKNWNGYLWSDVALPQLNVRDRCVILPRWGASADITVSSWLSLMSTVPLMSILYSPGVRWWWRSVLFSVSGCLQVIVRRLGRSFYKVNNTNVFQSVSPLLTAPYTRNVSVYPAVLAVSWSVYIVTLSCVSHRVTKVKLGSLSSSQEIVAYVSYFHRKPCAMLQSGTSMKT
jgi:hypothetical protein